MKRVVVLGASGSIGAKAVSYVRDHADTFHLAGASLHTSYEALRSTFECPIYDSRSNNISKFQLFLEEIQPDIVLNAIAGFAGLPYSLQVAEAGISLALANKETIICGGTWFMDYAAKHNCHIIPVDSEHSSIFQCIGYNTDDIDTITITASGGPFWKQDSLDNVTLQDALQHPTWQMGSKITIDSATMVNKSMELIEAMILFGVPYNRIKAIIEPTSNVHCIVSKEDETKTYVSFPPDMIHPIAYALHHPDTVPDRMTRIHDTTDLKFFPINQEMFKIFRLLDYYQDDILQHTISLNAANEVAVQAFLDQKIALTDIYEIIETVLNKSSKETVTSYSDIVDYDKAARLIAEKYV